MEDRAARYEQLARQCVQAAVASPSDEKRRSLLQMAVTLRRIARRAEDPVAGHPALRPIAGLHRPAEKEVIDAAAKDLLQLAPAERRAVVREMAAAYLEEFHKAPCASIEEAQMKALNFALALTDRVRELEASAAANQPEPEEQSLRQSRSAESPVSFLSIDVK